MEMDQRLDVVIIGGGPAGMNAALVLGRARKSVVVIDEERPRNGVTRESHGFLSRDGIAPAELRRVAREQILRYPSVRFVKAAAAAAEGSDGHFRIRTAGGEVYESRKLLFATGMRDLPLEISGLAEVYGRSAFVCPYCDGWELRDQLLVLIAKGARALHLAKMVSGWSSRITICTDGPDELSDEQREELAAHDVPVFDSRIRSIDSVEGMVQRVVLENGTEVACEGIFFAPKLAAGSQLPLTLGCRMTETGMVITEALGKTNIPGVYSAGDAASEVYQAISAASLGALAGAAINNELLMEAWEQQGR